jgi:hypothetical protein
MLALLDLGDDNFPENNNNPPFMKKIIHEGNLSFGYNITAITLGSQRPFSQ